MKPILAGAEHRVVSPDLGYPPSAGFRSEGNRDFGSGGYVEVLGQQAIFALKVQVMGLFSMSGREYTGEVPAKLGFSRS